MKRGWGALAAAVAMQGLLLITGCATPPPSGPDPKAAAQTYLAALKAGDYETCYRMLAEADLVHGSLDEFLNQVPIAPIASRRWFGQIEAATDYRMDGAAKRGTEVIFPVNVTTPNLVLWEHMLGAPNESKQTLQARAEKQLAGGDYPRLNYPDSIVLVREGEEWHILAGFAQRERIDRLHDQAVAAYHNFNYEQALALYRQILDRLDKAPFTGKGELACRFRGEMTKVAEARDSLAAAQAYLPIVKLKNVAAKPVESGGQGMFGQIVNSGERALDQVELTVSYYDQNGKFVASEKHTPIAIPLEFTDFDLPIVPFSPGEARDFGITLRTPGAVGQQNQPRVTVTGVIFSAPLASPPKFAGNRMTLPSSPAGMERSALSGASPASATKPGSKR
jgi:hypothetical protein